MFLRTASGSRIPVDLETCRADDTEDTLFDPKRHLTHFATCEAADKHRKKRGKK